MNLCLVHMRSIWAGLLPFILCTYGYLLLAVMMWFHARGLACWAVVIFYLVFFQFRGTSRTNEATIKALIGGNVLFLHLPQRIGYVARESHFALRIQLFVLSREQDLDTATMRQVREILEIHPHSLMPSLDEEEINAFSVHEHRITIQNRCSKVLYNSERASVEGSSSSSASVEVTTMDVDNEALEMEPICSMCTIPLGGGEPLLILPCLHKVHLECINDGLGRRVVCPVCDFPADLQRWEDAMCEDGVVRIY